MGTRVTCFNDLYFICLNFLNCIFMLFIYFAILRASRDEMAAAAGASAYPKSDSTQSGLVGNIHGQDIEAAKGNSIVY